MNGQGNESDGPGLSGATMETDSRRDPVVWTPELNAIILEGYSRGCALRQRDTQTPPTGFPIFMKYQLQ
jgi:hypothetical protein